MSRLLLLTIVCYGFAFAATSGAGKPDFTGDWTLNLDRSDFGKSAKPDGMSLKVTRNGNTMHAVQTTNSEGGPVTTESDWVLDGKQAKWVGNTLYSERRAIDGSINQKIWLTMSQDGKTATEKVWTKGPEGTNMSHLVWQHP